MVLCSTEYFKPHMTQFIAVFTASLGIFGNGIEYGWSSPAIPILQDSSRSPVDINSATEGPFWLQTLYIIGGICALPLTCFLANKIGRRRSILLGGSFGVIGWILTASAGHIIQLYVARFLCGIGANLHYVCIPMYTAEIAEPHIRGFLGTMIMIVSLIGVLISYCIVPVMPIWVSSVVAMAFPLTEIITFWFQPESPYYELMKRNHFKARVILQHLRNRTIDDVDAELCELTAAVERQEKERGRLQDLVLDSGNRKASIIMVLLNCGQHLAGSSVMVMNIQTIITSTGTESQYFMPPEWTSIVFAVTMILSAIFGSLLIDRIGRKFLLVSSYILSSIFMGILAYYLWNPPLTLYWLPFFATVGYAFCFKYGLGLVPIVVTSELFPTSLKAKGMVISDLWFTLMATLSIRMYYWFSEFWGEFFPFAVFTVCGLLFAAIIQFYMPETKGLTLEEIQFILKGKKKHTSVIRPILENSQLSVRYT